MGLQVILANTTEEGCRGVIARLQRQNTSGTRHIVITPDRFTLGVEKEILQTLGLSATCNIDVFSFTRLAVKLLKGSIHPCLSKEGTVFLLTDVLHELKDSLVYYKNLRSYGFARELFAAIASLRESGLTADYLEQKLPLLCGSTAKKFSDIVAVYKRYLERLTTEYTDTVTRLEGLLTEAERLPALRESHIYLIGFNRYSIQQMNLIMRFARISPSVTLAFSHADGSNTEYFDLSQKMELERFCADYGVPYEEEERYFLLKERFRWLHQNLFGYLPKTTEKTECDALRLFCEENPYEEVKAAAREIVHLVREKGYRYLDIAVAVDNREYQSILDDTFRRYGIPSFNDLKYPLCDTVPVRYLECLLNVQIQGYRKDSVFSLLHHIYCEFTVSEISAFENYVNRYNIDHQKFLSPFSLGEYGEAESVRTRLIARLVGMPKGRATVGEYAAFSRSVLSEERVERLIAEAPDTDDLKLVASLRFGYLTEVLEEMCNLLGGKTVNAEEFSDLLFTSVAGTGISLIPQYLDSVFCGNTKESRFPQVKVLFILGANDGFFPKNRTEGLILNTSDHGALKNAGIRLFPHPAEEDRLERFVFIDLVAKPRDILYVGCSTFNLAGERAGESEGYRELSFLTGKEKAPLKSLCGLTGEDAMVYFLSTPENAYYEYMRGGVPEEYVAAVYRFLEETGKSVSADEEGAEGVYSTYFFKRQEENYSTSVSQLECYFACPYRHYLQYGLRLREQETGFLQQYELGNIIHNVLEEYFKTNLSVLSEKDGEDERIKKSVALEFGKKEYAHYYLDTLVRNTLVQLQKECVRMLKHLTENVRHSRFVPTGIEMQFGFNGENRIERKTKRGNYQIRGKVDRVDQYGNLFIIIDYKTGSVSPDLKSIFCGEKIQLYTYLKVFTDKGLEPVGVFYLPIRAGYTKDGGGYAMKGQMKKDISVLEALDDRMADEASLESETVDLSLQRKKSGERYFSPRAKNLLTREEFLTLSDYVGEVSEKALEEIERGYAARKPLEGKCEYCTYANFCGEVEERRLSAPDLSDFALALQKENEEIC